MAARIESAEVLSFRLKVPPGELQRLPESLAGELKLSIENEGAELVVTQQDADSYLRFRPIGAEAMLSEIYLCNDDDGLFFRLVLVELMTRFSGDLHVRLNWSEPSRNVNGDHAEVRIVRGTTTYSDVTGSAAAAGQASELALEADTASGVPVVRADPEVQQLLDKAKAHWEEYQRLKSRRRS